MGTLKLLVEDDQGRRSVIDVPYGEITVGRDADNTVCIDQRDVSRHHLRIVASSDRILVENVSTSELALLNGVQLLGPTELELGDRLALGSYHLELRDGSEPVDVAREVTARTLAPDSEATDPHIAARNSRVTPSEEGESSVQRTLTDIPIPVRPQDVETDPSLHDKLSDTEPTSEPTVLAALHPPPVRLGSEEPTEPGPGFLEATVPTAPMSAAPPPDDELIPVMELTDADLISELPDTDPRIRSAPPLAHLDNGTAPVPAGAAHSKPASEANLLAEQDWVETSSLDSEPTSDEGTHPAIIVTTDRVMSASPGAQTPAAEGQTQVAVVPQKPADVGASDDEPTQLVEVADEATIPDVSDGPTKHEPTETTEITALEPTLPAIDLGVAAPLPPDASALKPAEPAEEVEHSGGEASAGRSTASGAGEGRSVPISLDSVTARSVKPVTPARSRSAAPAPMASGAPDPRAEPTALIRLDDDEPRNASGGRRLSIPARLVCISGHVEGPLSITRSEVVIGRTEDNEIAVDHRSVSRHHARIRVTADGYEIEDLSSANGTLVNGEAYARIALHTGDLVELGHVRFKFYPPGAGPSSAGMHHDGRRSSRGGLAVTTSSVARGGSSLWPLLLSVLLVCAAGAVAWKVSGRPWPKLGPTSSGVASQLENVEQAMTQARTLVEARRWSEARSLLGEIVLRYPDNESAATMHEQASSEQRAKSALQDAREALAGGRWQGAIDAMRSVSLQSVYASDAREIRQRAQRGLVAALSNEVHRAHEAGNAEAAGDLIERIATMDEDAARTLRAEVGAASSRGPTPAAPAEAPGSTTGGARLGGGRGTGTKVTRRTGPGGGSSGGLAGSGGGGAVAAYQEGVSAFKAGNLERATDAFARCVQKDSKQCRCYRNLGIVWSKRGQAVKAARFYRLYLKNCPTATDADKVEKILGAWEG